jgi:hypothetical protein
MQYSIKLRRICVIILDMETQQYLLFYCCWLRRICQQYKNVRCGHVNATMGSLGSVVEIQDIYYCC